MLGVMLGVTAAMGIAATATAIRRSTKTTKAAEEAAAVLHPAIPTRSDADGLSMLWFCFISFCIVALHTVIESPCPKYPLY